MMTPIIRPRVQQTDPVRFSTHPKMTPTNPLHSRTAPVAAVIFGLAAFGISMVFGPEYSGFTAGLLNIALLIGALIVFDAFVLTRSDSLVEIIEKGNVAYAIYLGLVVVAFAVCLTGL